MNIFESGIPNLRIAKAGSRRYSYEFVAAEIVLDAWSGYLKMQGNRKLTTDGTLNLNFGGYTGDQSLDWRPQIDAFHDLVENQNAIRDAVLKALSEKFEWLRQTYDWDQDGDVPRGSPVDFDFKPFVGPASISFDEEESKNGVSYVHWHFECDWDPEHGLAVITHRDRVIDLDRGETDPWKIYEDNGTLAEKQREYDERAKNFQPRPARPWWRFW